MHLKRLLGILQYPVMKHVQMQTAASHASLPVPSTRESHLHSLQSNYKVRGMSRTAMMAKAAIKDKTGRQVKGKWQNRWPLTLSGSLLVAGE